MSRKLGCAAVLFLALLSAGCDKKGPALSHSMPEGDSDEFESPDLGPVAADGPRVGALVDLAPIYAAAHKKSPIIGYLHAGEVVARSEKGHDNDQCIEGWYQIAPRGYVCTEKSTTIDMDHPTLRAMALRANREGLLPYTYAKTTKVTALFERKDDNSVELSGRLAKSTTMAIVGSWTAPDESKEPQRLGLKTDGRFVRADDLEAAQGSNFAGVALSAEIELPLAYVVRRGVRGWKLDGASAEKGDELQYHQRIDLTGRYRTVQGHKFWATKNGSWVRHEDVTVLRRRNQYPDWAVDGQKWIDLSVITGTAIAYDGQKAVYATLVSVGRDRLGDPKTTASTEMGTFRVQQKFVTRRTEGEADKDASLMDKPWALQLENGQWLYAALDHDRFGIEHSDGSVELSPRDAQFLWTWSSPELPLGWHGLVIDQSSPTTIVEIRK